MKEIGGYFEFERIKGEEYYPQLIALNTGRNALEYLIRAREISKLYIPYYLCDSISMLCERIGCVYDYYHIDNNFKPIFNIQVEANEYLYVVNYYGQLDDYYIKQIKSRYTNVIIDNVQAFFQKPVEGVDTIYSCRKFFGVPDGAYLNTDSVIKDVLKTDSSNKRMKHLLGRFEGNASDYYEWFKDNDRSFREVPLMNMSQLTHNILRGIDYKKVKKQREENYGLLHSKLEKNNKLKLRDCQGPYAYPFYCMNGPSVRKALAKKGIYIATLWPNVLDYEDCLEKDFALNILPLPCDQRYSVDDMDYLVKELFLAIGEFG